MIISYVTLIFISGNFILIQPSRRKVIQKINIILVKKTEFGENYVNLFHKEIN